MNKVKIIVLAFAALIGISNSAHAEVVLLQPDDFVGFTFWLLSMACLAATVFFFLERGSVAPGWQASITVAGSSYWYNFHTFNVCEKCMGYNWRTPQ